MGLVYLPTSGLFFYGKCRVYRIHTSPHGSTLGEVRVPLAHQIFISGFQAQPG